MSRVIYSAKEITDETVIIQRAMNGIHDAPTDVVNSISQRIMIRGVGNEKTLYSVQNDERNTMSTTQLLLITEKQDGTTEASYVTSIINDIAITADQVYAYTKETTGTDGYISCRIKTKIYYNVGTMAHGGTPDVGYCELTGVRGTWESLDSSVSIRDRQIKGDYYGFDLVTSSFVNKATAWYSTTQDTYQINLLSPAKLETGSGIGARMRGWAKCTLRQIASGREWTLEVLCEETYYMG